MNSRPLRVEHVACWKSPCAELALRNYPFCVHWRTAFGKRTAAQSAHAPCTRLSGNRNGGRVCIPDDTFLNRLREIGYTHGRNIDIITRYADADITRLPGLADELVRLQPDVIVAIDPPAAFAAKKATTSLPIVAAILNDPVRLGMIESYARPGGNVTGILSQVEGLPGKQVEIAREVVPG
jgi:ABC transporter substrate binding protein